MAWSFTGLKSATDKKDFANSNVRRFDERKVVTEILANFDVDFHVYVEGRHKYSLQAAGFCRQIIGGRLRSCCRQVAVC